MQKLYYYVGVVTLSLMAQVPYVHATELETSKTGENVESTTEQSVHRNPITGTTTRQRVKKFKKKYKRGDSEYNVEDTQKVEHQLSRDKTKSKVTTEEKYKEERTDEK